ncbi:MAG: hypothetical protein IJC18_05070 [Clostridia bacterium]|nr:hypothetical protein [Clostridia bacterium]
MIKKLQLSTFMTALRMGGYIGWALTVMYICRQSLHYYHDDSMLTSVNITFLTAAAITSAVLVVILLLLDIEGVLSDKLLRWLPGVFMAESGIALSLANAATMTVYAAVTGIAAAFGMLAVMSHLLRVKVGQRMISIGLALALGGIIRLVAGQILRSVSESGLVAVSIVIGIIALLTVHSDGYSRTDGGPLVSLAEAPPKTIISKVPYVYIVMFFCATAFYFASGHAETVALSKLPDTYLSYDVVAYAVFIITALLIAAFVKLPLLSILFVCGTGLAAAAAIFTSLPYFTESEATIFAIMSYCSLAAFKACIYMFIILFSLDRPHPLFYAMLGYTFAVGGELAGTYLDSVTALDGLRPYVVLLLLLMPVGGGLMAAGMKKYGFSRDQLDRRHMLSAIVRRKSEELELFEREQMMLQAVILDGYDIDQLAGKMLFSHNTVKVLLRPILKKFDVTSLDELREYFASLSQNEEQFLAQVQAAEQEKKDKDRRDRMEQIKQAFIEMREEKESARTAAEQAKAELAQAAEIVDAEIIDSDDIIIGGEDAEGDYPDGEFIEDAEDGEYSDEYDEEYDASAEDYDYDSAEDSDEDYDDESNAEYDEVEDFDEDDESCDEAEDSDEYGECLDEEVEDFDED